jgi:hypothetical protein
MKTIIKELVIVLLLILAIVLVLGVLLYDYIPMNKVVPQIEQYEAPDNIKEELEDDIEETENTMSPIVYEIDASDLSLYEKTNDYQKGNVNPFADVNSTTTTTSSGETNGDNSNTNSTGSTVTSTDTNTTTSNTTTSTNTNSEGTFLPSTGTK